MKNVKWKVIRMKNTTFINGDNFFAMFDCRAGDALKLMSCVFFICADNEFYEELAACDIFEFDRKSYFVERVDSVIVTVLPLAGYSNARMEEIVCHLLDNYTSRRNKSRKLLLT